MDNTHHQPGPLDRDVMSPEELNAHDEEARNQHWRDLETSSVPQSAAQQLPDDILRMIFEVHGASRVCRVRPYGSVSEHAPQVLCAQVCRRWRHVAFRTSTLWQSFKICDNASLHFASRMIDQLACQFGVSLELDGCTPAIDFGPLIAKLSNLPLTRLYASTCPHATIFLLSAIRLLPKLVDLQLRQPDCLPLLAEPLRMVIHSSVSYFPALERLELVGGTLSDNLQVGPNLRQLIVEGVICPSFCELIAFLHLTPNLEFLRFIVRLLGPVPVIHTLTPTLDRLRTLWIGACSLRAFLPTFGSTVFPRLDGITFHLTGSAAPSKVVLFTQFTCAQSSLTSLMLIIEDSGSEPPDIHLLNALFMRASDGSPILPRLSKLVVDAWYRGPEYWGPRFHPGLLQQLNTLLDKRLEFGCPLQQLVLAPPATPEDYEKVSAKVSVRMQHWAEV